MKRLLPSLSIVLLAVAGCPGDEPYDPLDQTTEGTADGSPSSDAPIGCPENPCPTDAICYEERCVADRGPCATNDDCNPDSFCDQGHCIPYGSDTKESDPTCANASFISEELVAPAVKCSWTEDWVYPMPIVIDLDGDAKPELIFVTGGAQHLVAIRGTDCSEVFDVPTTLYYSTQLAAGDLTGDGVPEIAGIDADGHVLVFDASGTLLATSPEAATGVTYSVGGPAIANVDQQGPPEIVYGGMTVRFSGGQLTTLYNVPVTTAHHGVLSGVADVDLDGKPEVVVGNLILDAATGADETPPAIAGLGGAYVAIADFDSTTPEPEIVAVTSQSAVESTVRIYHPVSGALLFGPYSFGQTYGGPPTVADFDGDGQPELAAAGYAGYAVFDLECTVDPLPAFCHSPGIRWLKDTRDKSSGCTGSSVFDFNGDGAAEVVYRDECWLRVYDGATGAVRFAHSITSGTGLELPAVADVDGDGHAEIVVSSSSITNCADEAELGMPAAAPTAGVYVLEDPDDRWMASRPIWNQHTYHITNVEDDGTIPVSEQNNWESWNNYRQNVQGMNQQDVPAPDLTAKKHVGVDGASDCVTLWVLFGEICNRGAVETPAGVKGTFYEGDPAQGGTPICTVETTQALAPGACEVLKCGYADPPDDAIDLWFVVDDDGDSGSQVECWEGNNVLHIPQIRCPGVEIE